MRSKSSSKQTRISLVNLSIEKHKVDKVKEEPHLSGAYIRSLVKHLTSTKTKDSFNGDENLPETLNTNEERCTNDHNNMHPQSSPPEPSPQPKKQVRRRQHTSKPYQERLLNMAEARKEIVTALKYHRASMKQQESANKHEPQLEQPSLGLEENSKIRSRRNPRAYPSTTTAATTTTATRTTNLSNNYLDHSPSLSYPPSIPYYWPISTISPPPLPPLYHANLNPTLPNQTLGLNLNFQDFKNLDASLYHNPLSNYSTSSSSSSCSSSSSAAVSASEEVVTNSTTTSSSGGNDLHQAMDDEEMKEIISLGEQHQMEWNDTMNLVISARWFDYLKSIETGPDDESTYNQIMELPPYMDIGEIEGMDNMIDFFK